EPGSGGQPRHRQGPAAGPAAPQPGRSPGTLRPVHPARPTAADRTRKPTLPAPGARAGAHLAAGGARPVPGGAAAGLAPGGPAGQAPGLHLGRGFPPAAGIPGPRLLGCAIPHAACPRTAVPASAVSAAGGPAGDATAGRATAVDAAPAYAP